jgi:hypothetical protein
VSPVPERIREAILRAYGSLDEPTFRFVGEALRVRPYRDILTALARHGVVKDDTVPDDDVSFGAVLETATARYVLRLSMLGPFAVLLRMGGGDGPADVVTAGTAHAAEGPLLADLSAHGFELLDRATLEQAVPLALPKTPTGETLVYQALFVDNDVVPWR